MEDINKKNLLHIFLGVIMIQSLFLLVYSANFLLAETTTNTLAIEFVNIPSSPLSGDQTIYAQTSKMANSIIFKVIPGIDGTAYTPYSGTLVSGYTDKYQFIWPTASFTNGIYDVRAIAYDGTSTTDVYAYGFQVQNETVTTDPLAIEFVNLPSSLLSGDQTIYAQTSGTVNSVEFKVIPGIDGTAYTRYSGTLVTGSDNEYSFIWPTASFADGTYDLRAIAYDGTSTVGVYADDFQVQNETTTDSPADTESLAIEFINLPSSPLSGDQIIYAQTSKMVDSVVFKVIPDIDGAAYTPYTGTLISGYTDKYQFIWPTASFADGTYDVRAIAYDGTSMTDVYAYDFQVQNETAEEIVTDPPADETATIDPLAIKFINIPSSPLSGDQTIHAQTSKMVNSVEFKIIPGINGTAYARYSGTLVTGSDNEYSFIWPTDSFANGIYDVRAIAYDGTSTVDVYANDFQVQNETVDEPVITTPLSIQFVNFPSSPFSNDQIIYTETNQSVTSVIFKVLTNGIAVGTYTGIADNAKPYRYYFTWPTANFNDGNYMIKTIASNRTETVYDFKYIEVSNNLPIDSTNASLAVKFIEDFQVPIKGDQKISISANQEILSCMFKIEGPKFAELLGTKDSSTQCHILLHTINFPNGYYTIRAIVKNNTSTAEIKLDTRIENIEESSTTQTKPTDEIYPVKETDPVTYDDYVYPETFIFELPFECKEKNISTPEECQKYMSIPFECREKDILNLEECEKFMMENFMPFECKEAGITTKEECDHLLRNTLTSFESFSATKIEPPYIARTEEVISSECKEEGITSFEACKEHMILINMPEECQLAKITDQEECKKIIFEKHGPQECIQAQIFNAQECEKFMFKEYTPDDCQKAGILNPEACKKFIFEKYSEGKNIPAEKFPIECKKENVKTIEQCAKVMQKIYMPKECKDEGLENEKECEIYLQQKHMPKECLEAGIKNRQECDGIMFKKYAPQECLKANIENGTKCEEFIFNKYAPEVKCDNIESWQCKNSVKERYLGSIVAKQTVYNRINEKKEEITGKSIEVTELETKIIQKENSVPILKKNLKLKILPAKESLVLNEEDNLIQTSPIIVMIDSDGDGLPDDIEQRFGTDPYKTDTDGDGFDDLAEIKNGYDPLGNGKLENEVASIEKAIIENKTLEHPKTAGQVNENLTIEDISNTKDDEGNITSEYILSGTSESNSIATIYIYSDLPIVVTVKTDKYGNWEYELKESLIDGEHEAYVVINDDTGKVLSKSNPINFFIKEAKAVSVKNFITPAITPFEIPKESENSLFYYLIAAVGIMIFAIMIFMTFIIKKKRT